MPPQSETPILRTESLSREVDGHCIVRDISVAVWEQDVLAVVGPSGAGKSSFLRLLNRLDEPTRGTIFLQGQDYRTVPPHALRRQVGLLMQAPHLFPGTVAANLRFGPRQRGEDLSQEKIQTLLAQVDLPGYAERDVRGLSGGEAQRVALARLLANSPQVLLLDEPTAALDKTSARQVEGVLHAILGTHHRAIVLVTHDEAQASRLANRVMRMQAGRVMALGPVREVLHAE